MVIGSLGISATKIDVNSNSKIDDTHGDFYIEMAESDDEELILGYEPDWKDALSHVCAQSGADIVETIEDFNTVEMENEIDKRLLFTKLDLSGVESMDQFNKAMERYTDPENFQGFNSSQGNLKYYSYYEPNDPYWDGIDLDSSGDIDKDNEYQWGPRKMFAQNVWGKNKGRNVRVAVLDTGLERSHVDAPAHIVYAKDIVDNDNNPEDDSGHGTHCCGVIAAQMNNNEGIAGIAPECEIMPVKVLGRPYTGPLDAIVGTAWDISKGIVYAANHGADIISMSLGGPLPSILMSTAISYAHRVKRCFIVSSSGNEAESRTVPRCSHPAMNIHVVSVGAIDSSKRRCDFSNYGGNLNFVAPGYDIISLWKGDSYKACRGTSMSCPHVAAAAALYMSKTGYYGNFFKRRPGDVKTALEESASTATLLGPDIEFGHGLINLNSLFENARQDARSYDNFQFRLTKLIGNRPIFSNMFNFFSFFGNLQAMKNTVVSC